MKSSIYLRWITAWWIAAVAILAFGVYAKAQTYGSPQTTISAYSYDNTAGSGTKIGTITIFASSNPCLTYDINFIIGLTVVTATASSDLTVSYY